jgi:hypothetical protein
MLNKEILIQRLSIIKMLFKMGVDYSRYGEIYLGLSILAFHDCIEMFLNLVVENSQKGEKKPKHAIFETILKSHPELSHRDSIISLNTVRNNLKHDFILPSRGDVVKYKQITEDFFVQNTPKVFNLEFKDISLISLIKDENVKQFIMKSETFLNENQEMESIEQIAYAFDELIHNYEKNKMKFGDSPFSFGQQTYRDSFSEKQKKVFEEYSKYANNRFSEIERALKILALGIDYKRYAKFIQITPVVTRIGEDNLYSELTRNIKFNPDNCLFCIDFVTETALKLQEFDFDDDDLYKNTFTIIHEMTSNKV